MTTIKLRTALVNAIACVLAAGCAGSQVSVSGVNDALAFGPVDDASYTQALRVTVTPTAAYEPCDEPAADAGDCDRTGAMRRIVKRLNFLAADDAGDDQSIRLEYVFGQRFYTPNDLAADTVVVDDRPYAGWLYGGLRIHNDRVTAADTPAAWLSDRRRTVALDAGVVGPMSQADAFQQWWHREICKCTYPRGWHLQVANEPGFVLSAAQEDRVAFRGLGDLWSLDVLTRSAISLGNVYTGIDAGATIRVGRGLPRSFSPLTESPQNLVGPAPAVASEGFSVYGFAGVMGRAVLRDVFLDGTLFRDSIHTVDKEPFVVEGQVGLGLRFRKWSLRLSYVRRSDEFRVQSRTQRFGILALTYTPQPGN